RDVEKVDRQDDRAAARLLSSDVLAYHLGRYPHRHGVALYLFFMGELFDAWQNCRLPHTARILMVLRCRYFLTAWRQHIISHPDHSLHRNFISRESYDIFITLCDSLISLILVYRELYAEYPLLPWLHSTESVEHVFGVLRQLKADFTFWDFLTLVPKLSAILGGTFISLSEEERANRTAAGYWHTYLNSSDIDLEALVAWPSDELLGQLTDRALADVVPIMDLVGIDAAAML
ncbi:hypothetical protein EXIGLDRAFT_574013, partial [Exidia glandulosa HHB12029]